MVDFCTRRGQCIRDSFSPMDVGQLAVCRIDTQLSRARFPGAPRDFSPRANFRCRLCYGVRTPPCADVCINICAHVKNPEVHIRVRWIMEILKHLARTVSWVARFCRSWLSPGKTTRNSHGRSPNCTISSSLFFVLFLTCLCWTMEWVLLLAMASCCVNLLLKRKPALLHTDTVNSIIVTSLSYQVQTTVSCCLIEGFLKKGKITKNMEARWW